MHMHVLLCINRHMIAEVPSFTDSEDIIGRGQHFKNGSLDPDHTQ